MNRPLLTNSTFARLMAEKNGISIKEANNRAKEVFEVLKLALAEGNDVQIQNFATFSVVDVPERMGNDVKTGEKRLFPATVRVKAKFSDNFKNIIKNIDC